MKASNTMPRKNTHSFKKENQTSPVLIRFFSILFFLLILTGFYGIFWLFKYLPQFTEEKFGSPAEGLKNGQILLYSLQLFYFEDDLLLSNEVDGTQVTFEIFKDEPLLSLSSRLQDEELIRNADALRIYLGYSGLDTSIQVGEFTLNPAMNAIEIAHVLQNGVSKEIEFSILAGWRLEEIAGTFHYYGLNFNGDDFLRACEDPLSIGVFIPESLQPLPSIEGYLLPGVYSIDRSTELRDLLTFLLAQFDEQVTPDLREAYQQQGLDLSQAVILASIIQRESMLEEENPIIASLYLNRFRSGMKLESDPTVQYAIGYNDQKQIWWENSLSVADLGIDSPYNTYLYPGLPPSAICNPGISALRAVAYPEKTSYYYMRAACDQSGKHNFTETFQEHVLNACP